MILFRPKMRFQVILSSMMMRSTQNLPTI